MCRFGSSFTNKEFTHHNVVPNPDEILHIRYPIFWIYNDDEIIICVLVYFQVG